MTAALVSALLLLAVVGSYAALQVRKLRRSIEVNTEETRQLRLNSRSRITTAAVRTGADGEEQHLRQMRRLGRATRAKRIVVGGDPDSEQYAALNRTVRDDHDGE